MDWHEFFSGFKDIWQNKPGVIVLLALGFLVFIFVVLDARRHKQRQRRKHPKKY